METPSQVGVGTALSDFGKSPLAVTLRTIFHSFIRYLVLERIVQSKWQHYSQSGSHDGIGAFVGSRILAWNSPHLHRALRLGSIACRLVRMAKHSQVGVVTVRYFYGSLHLTQSPIHGQAAWSESGASMVNFYMAQTEDPLPHGNRQLKLQQKAKFISDTLENLLGITKMGWHRKCLGMPHLNHSVDKMDH